MKRLILLRHAKSDWGDPDLDDIDRPLNQRGEKNAPVIGERLRKLGIKPERIISSPARRARDTARLLAGQLTLPEIDVLLADRIYEADTAALLETVAGIHQELECVMLVGHNPGLTELANLLGRLGIANLPTCAAVGLELEIKNWQKIAPGCGRLWFYDYPKNPAAAPLTKLPREHQG
jgi:phosphohistidine phosphatase